MYRYLWSNGPKEGLEFADYSFEEHFGKQIASYPPRAVLFDYIEGRVLKADVRKWIRFSSVIRWVEYDTETGDFEVTVHDMTDDRACAGPAQSYCRGRRAERRPPRPSTRINNPTLCPASCRHEARGARAGGAHATRGAGARTRATR